MGIKRMYTKEFKESAIELYHKSGKTRAEVAEGLGIHSENLCRWLREAQEGKKSPHLTVFPGQGKPRDEELVLLRKEVAGLRESNEILKKAMAFFVVKDPR